MYAQTMLMLVTWTSMVSQDTLHFIFQMKAPSFVEIADKNPFLSGWGGPLFSKEEDDEVDGR